MPTAIPTYIQPQDAVMLLKSGGTREEWHRLRLQHIVEALSAAEELVEIGVLGSFNQVINDQARADLQFAWSRVAVALGEIRAAIAAMPKVAS